MTINFSDLRKELPYKWKPNNKRGTGKYTKFQCVAYIDARQARDLLDEVVGAANWASDYKEVKNSIYCGIGINVNAGKKSGEFEANPHWVWKWDCGTESQMEKEKGSASDGFKRACVQWGIGRFLYDFTEIVVGAKEHTNKKFYVANKAGKIAWKPEDVKAAVEEMYPNLKRKTQNTTQYNPKVENKVQTKNPAQQNQKEKYDSNKTGTYNNKVNLSKKVIDRINALNKDGKTGGAVLKSYLKDYNKDKGKQIKELKEFYTDKLMLDLVEFVENKPPKSMNEGK